ncbi:hypothetical protein SXANM310S_03033 [Streptomyces xanthochromogenes]
MGRNTPSPNPACAPVPDLPAVSVDGPPPGPVGVRIAGLPTLALDHSRIPVSTELALRTTALDQRLTAEAAQLSDSLYALIGTEPARPFKARLVGPAPSGAPGRPHRRAPRHGGAARCARWRTHRATAPARRPAPHPGRRVRRTGPRPSVRDALGGKGSGLAHPRPGVRRRSRLRQPGPVRGPAALVRARRSDTQTAGRGRRPAGQVRRSRDGQAQPVDHLRRRRLRPLGGEHRLRRVPGAFRAGRGRRGEPAAAVADRRRARPHAGAGRGGPAPRQSVGHRRVHARGRTVAVHGPRPVRRGTRTARHTRTGRDHGGGHRGRQPRAAAQPARRDRSGERCRLRDRPARSARAPGGPHRPARPGARRRDALRLAGPTPARTRSRQRRPGPPPLRTPGRSRPDRHGTRRRSRLAPKHRHQSSAPSHGRGQGAPTDTYRWPVGLRVTVLPSHGRGRSGRRTRPGCLATGSGGPRSRTRAARPVRHARTGARPPFSARGDRLRPGIHAVVHAVPPRLRRLVGRRRFGRPHRARCAAAGRAAPPDRRHPALARRHRPSRPASRRRTLRRLARSGELP